MHYGSKEDWRLPYTNIYTMQNLYKGEDLEIRPEGREFFEPSSGKLFLLSARFSDFIVDDYVGLIYLDIGPCTKTASWLSILDGVNFPNLRILKIDHLRLTNGSFPKGLIQGSFGLRLWSLDLSHNLLDDRIIKILLDSLCPTPIMESIPVSGIANEALYEATPSYEQVQAGTVHESLNNIDRRPDTPNGLLKYVTKQDHWKISIGVHLDENDTLLAQTGLTHLYISDNRLTSGTLKRFLRGINRLQVLDVGSLTFTLKDEWKPYFLPIPFTKVLLQTESITELNRRSYLEELRCHHSIVTLIPTILSTAESSTGFSLDLVSKAESLSKSQELLYPEPLSPLKNYRLRKLTLTDIPLKSYGPTILALLSFLDLCRQQELKIKAARKDNHDNRRAPPVLSGLRILRLEFINEDNKSKTTISVSGHEDADKFYASSAGDFSFFSETPMPFQPRKGSSSAISTITSPSRRPSVANDTVSGLSSTAASPASTPTTERKMSFLEAIRTTTKAFLDHSSSSDSPPLTSSSNGARSGSISSRARDLAQRPVFDVPEKLREHRKYAPRWGGTLELYVPTPANLAQEA
jgi:hypothetical protein